MEENLSSFYPHPKNYHTFIKLVLKTASIAISKGHIYNSISFWHMKFDAQQRKYGESGNQVTTNRLMAPLDKRIRGWIGESQYTSKKSY